MKVLITGGAGFIGRWVVKEFLDNGHTTIVLDNLVNSTKENIKEFELRKNFNFINGDILNKDLLKEIFNTGIDLCLHLAALISVQESIEKPQSYFETNVMGTMNLLENCRKHHTKFILVSTCMVYDTSAVKAIGEEHAIRPASPYAGSKAAAEYLALSYYHSYNLPVVILRPFNTYGPYQKSNLEGGVVCIFINNKLKGRKLDVFGDGTQTRDLLYVEDCSSFIYKAALSKKAVGQVINGGYGKDTSINDLAYKIAHDRSSIARVKHHHPQAEIPKLLCDNSKAKRLLNWKPRISLDRGIKITEEWIRLNNRNTQ